MPKKHGAPRCIERTALIGKTQRHRCPFEAINDVRSRNQAAERRALPRYPLNRAKYLNAGATAATPTQTAAANARLNKVVHMSRPYDCRRERDGVSLPPAPVLLHIVAGDG